MTNIRGLRQADGIDRRERTLAVAYQHPIASCINVHIVGIVTELDAPDRGQIHAPQHSHRAIAGVRHKYAIGKGNICNALRLAHSGDSTQYLAR